MKRRCQSNAFAIISTAVLIALTAALPARPQGQPRPKPNILVIWGDDVGRDNMDIGLEATHAQDFRESFCEIFQTSKAIA